MLAAICVVVAGWLGVHCLYVVAMAAKAAMERDALTPYWWVMLAPAAALAVVLDFVFQHTFGWVMFLETPYRGGLLFSGRVQHHYRNSFGWRRELARWWARNLNVFDAQHIR